jgi:hypothetical protein
VFNQERVFLIGLSSGREEMAQASRAEVPDVPSRLAVGDEDHHRPTRHLGSWL